MHSSERKSPISKHRFHEISVFPPNSVRIPSVPSEPVDDEGGRVTISLPTPCGTCSPHPGPPRYRANCPLMPPEAPRTRHKRATRGRWRRARIPDQRTRTPLRSFWRHSVISGVGARRGAPSPALGADRSPPRRQTVVRVCAQGRRKHPSLPNNPGRPKNPGRRKHPGGPSIRACLPTGHRRIDHSLGSAQKARERPTYVP